MLDRLVTASLEHRAVVLLLAALLVVWGVFSFQGLTIEAFPDPTDTQVQVITRSPGQPAEEMERQVSIPIERAVNGTPGLARVRAINLFGLSYVTLTFREGVDVLQARAQTLERLREAELPDEVVPELGFGVAVTTNGDTWNPGEMTYAIVDHYAGPIAFPPVDPTPLTLGPIPGAWNDQWQMGHITITDTGSGLEIAFTDFGKTFPLERYSDVAFSTTHPQDGVQFEIVVWPDAEGNARWLVSRAGVAARL